MPQELNLCQSRTLMKRKQENSRNILTHLLCTYNPKDKWRPSSPLKQKLLDFYVPYLRGQLTSPYHDHQVLNLRLQNEVKMGVSHHRRPPSLVTSISSPGLLGLEKRGQSKNASVYGGSVLCSRMGSNSCARGGEGTLHNGLYGEAPPERDTFSVFINIIITIIPRTLMGSESIAHEAERVADPGGSAGFLAAKKD